MQNVPSAEPLVAEDYSARAVKPDQEYWKPILPRREESTGQYAAAEAMPLRCPNCSSNFVEGARFCHVCGGLRARAIQNVLQQASGSKIRQGLSSGIFAAGLLFSGIAASLSWIYSPIGYESWQAVQNWRMQWLLAAAVAFLACLCLKPKAR